MKFYKADRFVYIQEVEHTMAEFYPDVINFNYWIIPKINLNTLELEGIVIIMEDLTSKVIANI